MRKRSWLCELATTLVISGLLYSVCIDPVVAQNVTCPTRPLGDNSNACASTAFVQAALASSIPLAHTHIFVGNVSNKATDFGSLATFADTGGLTIAPSSGVALTLTGPSNSLARVLDITQSFAGTDTVTHHLNSIAISDSANLGTAVGNGLNIAYVYSSGFGSRQALQAGFTLAAPSNASNTAHFYTALATNAQANSGDNGTNTGAGSKGSIISMNPVVTLGGSATNISELYAIQAQVQVAVGATTRSRVGLVINDISAAGSARGAVFDDAIQLTNAGSAPGWLIGLAFDGANNAAPLATTGTAIATVGAQTMDTFIDVSSATVSTNLIKGPGSNFIVTGAGAITAVGSITSSGTITAATIAGGSTSSSTLTLESTSGSGTTDATIFKTASQTERARITTGGLFNIGPNVTPDALLTVMANTTATVAPPGGTNIHLIGADTSTSYILADSFGGQTIFNARRAQGTVGSKTAVTLDNILFRFGGDGWDGSAYTTTASFATMAAAENWSNTAHGTYIAFNITPKTTTTFAEAGRFQDSGCLSVGYTTACTIGVIAANNGFKSGANAGLSATTTVRASGGAADCTLIFTGGLKTGGTC